MTREEAASEREKAQPPPKDDAEFPIFEIDVVDRPRGRDLLEKRRRWFRRK